MAIEENPVKKERAVRVGNYAIFSFAVSLGAVLGMFVSFEYNLLIIGAASGVMSLSFWAWSSALYPTKRMKYLFRPLVAVLFLFGILLFNNFSD